MVLGHGSPNGFLRRAFESGADDIVMLPATREQIRFEVHKLLARKQGAETPAVSGHVPRSSASSGRRAVPARP